MASFQELRAFGELSVGTDCFAVPSARDLRLATFATPSASATVVFVAAQLASHSSKMTNPAPGSVLDAHGAPQPHVLSTRGPAPSFLRHKLATPRALARVDFAAAQLASHGSKPTNRTSVAGNHAFEGPQPREALIRRPVTTLQAIGGLA
jgi:hypothetical protein